MTKVHFWRYRDRPEAIWTDANRAYQTEGDWVYVWSRLANDEHPEERLEQSLDNRGLYFRELHEAEYLGVIVLKGHIEARMRPFFDSNGRIMDDLCRPIMDQFEDAFKQGKHGPKPHDTEITPGEEKGLHFYRFKNREGINWEESGSGFSTRNRWAYKYGIEGISWYVYDDNVPIEEGKYLVDTIYDPDLHTLEYLGVAVLGERFVQEIHFLDALLTYVDAIDGPYDVLEPLFDQFSLAFAQAKGDPHPLKDAGHQELEEFQ